MACLHLISVKVTFSISVYMCLQSIDQTVVSIISYVFDCDNVFVNILFSVFWSRREASTALLYDTGMGLVVSGMQ